MTDTTTLSLGPVELTLADGESRAIRFTWPDQSFACPFCGSPENGQEIRCSNPGCRVNMTADRLAASRQQEADEAARRAQAESIHRFNVRQMEEQVAHENELWAAVTVQAANRGSCLICLRDSDWRGGQPRYVRHRTTDYHDPK